MLVVAGKCPHCGNMLTLYYDMISEDDSLRAEVYDWVESTPAHFGPAKEDPHCPECKAELYLALKAEAFITAESEVDPEQYVDFDEEQELKRQHEIDVKAEKMRADAYDVSHEMCLHDMRNDIMERSCD